MVYVHKHTRERGIVRVIAHHRSEPSSSIGFGKKDMPKSLPKRKKTEKKTSFKDMIKKSHTHWVAGKKWNTRIKHSIDVKHKDPKTMVRHDLATGELQKWAKRKKLHLVDSTFEKYKKEVLEEDKDPDLKKAESIYKGFKKRNKDQEYVVREVGLSSHIIKANSESSALKKYKSKYGVVNEKQLSVRKFDKNR